MIAYLIGIYTFTCIFGNHHRLLYWLTSIWYRIFAFYLSFSENEWKFSTYYPLDTRCFGVRFSWTQFFEIGTIDSLTFIFAAPLSWILFMDNVRPCVIEETLCPSPQRCSVAACFFLFLNITINVKYLDLKETHGIQTYTVFVLFGASVLIDW